MPVPARVLSRSVGLDPDGYPYETPQETQGDAHKAASQRLEHALNLHLSRWLRAGTYKLSGDLGLHRRVGGGDPYQAPAPDIIVYLQAPDMQGRQSFRLEEDGPPDLVLEILTARTWTRDIGDKRTLYEAMGIGEYWLYDSEGRCLRGARAGLPAGRGPVCGNHPGAGSGAAERGPAAGTAVAQRRAANRMGAGCAGGVAPAGSAHGDLVSDA